jgi:hypothetical protein
VRRDDEIERLTKYAQGMGLKVTFSNSKSADCAADWSTDGSEITIYRRQNDSKTETILSMIHEIAHHLWFIHERNRKPDLKLDEAVGVADWQNAPEKLPKRFRKRIYDMEHASTGYWEAIFKETDLKIPKWKLNVAMAFDVWQYEIYLNKGKFPGRAEENQKRKELVAKYKTGEM